MPRAGAAVLIALVGLLLSSVAAPATGQDYSRSAAPAADSQASAKAGKTGKLKVRVIGLPDPAKVVTVKGPKKYKKSLKKSKTLKKLRPGKYRIKAKATVSTPFTTYERVSRKKQTVKVRKGKKTKVKVEYRDGSPQGILREEPSKTASPTATPAPQPPAGPPAGGPPPPVTPVSPSTPPPVPPSSPPTPPTSSPPPPPTAPPTAPPGLSVKALGAGTSHSCAVLLAGTVYCWGANDHGQLGEGTTTDSDTPRQAVGITDAVAVDTGERSTCALLSTGEARCWGDNSTGELGNAKGGDGTDQNDSATPVAVVDDQGGALGDLTDIAVGQNHACAVQNGGDPTAAVWCWGANNLGQIGIGQAGPEEPHAVKLTAPGPRPTQVTAGGSFSCTLLGNGRVECWGDNEFGQLGDSSAAQSDSATQVDLGGRRGTSISAGDDHACASVRRGRQDASVCWGENQDGQLNGEPGSPTDTTKVPPVDTGLSGAAELRPGGFHSCALADGSVRCWGGNFAGELGIGTTTSTPGIQTVKQLDGVEILAAGTNHNCAASVDGKVYCWGDNDSGEVGPGGGQNISLPREVPLP